MLTSKEIEQGIFDSPYYKSRSMLFQIFPEKINLSKKQIVFLGDSITDQGEWAEIFKDRDEVFYNRGINGDTIGGIINRINDLERLCPDKIFIMIGINNLAIGQNAKEAKIAYRLMIKKLLNKLTGTEIYVESLLPINNDVYKNIHIPDNIEIIKLNSYIREITVEYQLKYIDLYSIMLNSERKMNLEYTFDGCHLNVSVKSSGVGIA